MSSQSPNPECALLEQFAAVAKALGHGHRLALLQLLAQGERSVEALACLAGLSVANASQHLQQLRRAGLVAAHKDGKRVLYRLADEAVVTLMRTLRGIAERNLAEVERIVASHFRKRDELKPLSARELMRKMRAGLVTVVDVRPPEEFRAGHIPGALNIPVSELRRRIKELPRSQEVVAYCRGFYCVLSYEAVGILRRQGFKARRLADGYPEWKRLGHRLRLGT